MTPDRPKTHRAVVAAAVLAALSLTLHLTLARQFQRVGVFEQINVLFQADISTRLRAIAGGNQLGIKHPNLMPYFTPPVTLVAKAITRIRPAGGPEPELRETLGTFVVPVASALKTAVVFSLFHRLGFSMAAAIVATGLEMLSFSTLIFGSIPESYGLTALALALAYRLGASSRPQLTWGRMALWMAIGVFAMGITVTNIVLVGLLLVATAWRTGMGLTAVTIRSAAIVIAIFGVTAVSAYVLDRLLVQPETSRVEGVISRSAVVDRVARALQKEFTGSLESDFARNLRRFPTSISNAFAPPAVARVPIRGISRHRSGFTLENTPNIFELRDLLGLSLLLLVIAGALCSLATPFSRPIAAASLGIVAFSWTLSAWGSETHLYSQHWHLAAVVLIAGLMRAGRFGGFMTAVLGVLTLLVAANNLLIVREMLAVLAAVPP